MSEAKGIWIDGRISKEELEGLQQLLKTACEKFGKKELPWSFQNEKIVFRAWMDGSTLHVFYGWNYPPAAFWSKEAKSLAECRNCFPHKRGEKGSPVREVWCEKQDYHFAKCPYGVCTEPEHTTSRSVAS
jgi:hypothetical protein